MAKKNLKEIPVAERITEFRTGTDLMIIDGWNICHYDAERLIVRYKCDEVASVYLEGGFRLNSFIESITVSTAVGGKKFGVSSGRITEKKIESDTIVYYTDHIGIRHAVIQKDIYDFLIRQPNLVISPEGVLIFFTDKEIIATVDCNHYYWINGYIIDVNEKTIKDIKVCKDFCKVTLIDDEKVKHNFKLKFDFDIAAYQMICPKVERV